MLAVFLRSHTRSAAKDSEGRRQKRAECRLFRFQSVLTAVVLTGRFPALIQIHILIQVCHATVKHELQMPPLLKHIKAFSAPQKSAYAL